MAAQTNYFEERTEKRQHKAKKGKTLTLFIPEINFILDSLKLLEGGENPADEDDITSTLYYIRKLQRKIKKQLESTDD